MSSNHPIPDNEDFPALTSSAPTAQVRGVWAQRKPDQMMKLSSKTVSLDSESKPSAWANNVPNEATEVSGVSGNRGANTSPPPPNGSSSVIDSSGAAETPSPIKAPSPASPISIDLELSKLHLNDSSTLQTTSKSLLSPEENMWSSLRNVDPKASKLPSEGDKSCLNLEAKVSHPDCISSSEENSQQISNECVPVNIPASSPTTSSAPETSEVVLSPTSSSSSPKPNTPAVAPQPSTPPLNQADFPSLCPSAPVPTPVWNRAGPPPPTTPVSPPIESPPIVDIDFNESSNRKSMKRLSLGTRITLMTNCYPMTVKTTKVNYYDVKMKKEYMVKGQKRYDDLTTANKNNAKKKVDNKELNLNILKLVFRRLHLLEVPFVYDGCHNSHLLNTLESLIGRKKVSQRWEKEDLPEDIKHVLFNQSMNGAIHVSLDLNEKVPSYQLEEIYNESLDEGGVTACRNVIQLILLQPAKNGDFIILAQNQVFEKSKFRRTEGQKFEMSELVKVGIKAAVKVGEGENGGKGVPFICLDHCKSNFFLEGPLLSVQQYLSVNFEIQASCRILKGLEVYSILNNIKMRIVDFSAESLENLQFKETNSDEWKSVWDNAAKLSKKKKSEFNKNWKVAHVRFDSSSKVYFFPIEMLNIAPYQKMGPQHGQAPTPSVPQERVRESQRIAEKAGILKTNKLTNLFGINVESEPIQVAGWTLNLPQILYAGPNNKPHRVLMDAAASWSPSGKFVAQSNVKRIHILYTESKKNQNLHEAVEAFKKDLMNESAYLWMKLTDKQITIEKLDVEYKGGNNLEGVLTAKLQTFTTDTYVIYIDEKRDNPSHGAVKLVERRTGRMIQHIAIDEALKRMKSKSTSQFILMKMNVKLGGLNHRVLMNSNISHLWGESSNTLIISYDVCHSSGARPYAKGEDSDEPSVVGFGFNGLRLPEQVIGDFAFQDSRQEQVDCEILMKKTQWMVNLYCENRKNCPPANIVILRDGVSEGQYKMTQNKELNAILNGIHGAMRMRKMNTFRPKFAYIIATKRHANRLFVKNGDSITNAPPMTAVDTGIVRKGGDEIIFVSHHPLGGTAQPIMLNTLHNEIFESHDQLISFIGALCCTHQRSTSVISLPETIFTADAYAKRGAELFETYSHSVKKNKLPMREKGKPDWAAITDTLCYQTSTFATKCMV